MCWGIGAVASVLLSLAHLPFGLTFALIQGDPWWPFALPAILLAQAGLCLVCAVGWLDRRGVILAMVVAALTGAQAVVARLVWWDYSPHLWLLWGGPIPMLAPALIQLAAAGLRRRRSPRVPTE